MEYICKTCNKNYASYQSLWIHNKKYHTTENHKQPQPIHKITQLTTNNLLCKYCNKIYSRTDSLNRHYNSCKVKKQHDITIKNNSDLEEKIKKIIQLENKTNNKTKINKINNGNSNKVNGNMINTNITINKTGAENINLLNYEDVSIIFDNEISSVIKLIELVNFSENTPENHSFCSTNLDSPYLSFYNTDTNSINKERKRYFFEEVICKSIQNHEILYSSFKNKFNFVKQKQIEDNINSLKKIKENSFSSKIMGEMIRKLNLISYNNRDLIQTTWTSSKNRKYDYESDEEFMTMLLDDPETQKVIAEENNKKLNRQIINKIIPDRDSDSD